MLLNREPLPLNYDNTTFIFLSKVDSFLSKQLRPVSEKFLKQIQLQKSNDNLQQNTDNYKWIMSKNKGSDSQEIYMDHLIYTSLPLPLLFFVCTLFFIFSSIYYCAIFMWKNPVDGLFFTGMLFTTTENAEISLKVS